MAAADGFFDLSKHEVAELAIEISETDEGCRVDSIAGQLFEVVNCAVPDERRDPLLYSSFVCQTARVGERETCALVVPITGATLGYVFPVTAFRDSENFQGAWPRRFADVGFRYATTFSALSNFGAAVSIESLRGHKLYLDQVFDDRLSIAVLGNDAREGLGVDPDTLELMLFKQGIGIVNSRLDILQTTVPSPWSNRIKLTKPGPLVAREAAVFLSLLKSADRDRVGIGAFMHLYQALEFCIDHIFGWGVEKIARQRLDTWEMKNQLSQITGEPYRLSLLDAEYLRTLSSRATLNDLADGCRDFLSALSVEFDGDTPWHKLLYKCRNIIVHNQIMMMKVPNVPLQTVVNTLRAAAIEILFCFGTLSGEEAA
jgi:hypothetical protein